MDDYCADFGDKEQFTCESNGQVIATANAPHTWDPSWDGTPNNDWGTGYQTQAIDKTDDCRAEAEAKWGDLLLDFRYSCSATIEWAYMPHRDSGAFISHTQTVGFGDPSETGNVWVPIDNDPIDDPNGPGYRIKSSYPNVVPAIDVHAISCSCYALVHEAD